MFRFKAVPQMIKQADALEGREQAILQPPMVHYLNGHSIFTPFPVGSRQILIGMGCFWGAERCFWTMDGVLLTAVGYAGGYTLNPTYEEVCSGRTGHAEVVLVCYDPTLVPLKSLLHRFFERHDPTQGMRQGNDLGTQYRSALYLTSSEEVQLASAVQKDFQNRLVQAGFGTITTEIKLNLPVYYAEEYHQQYLAKNPQGYCGLGGTGVCF